MRDISRLGGICHTLGPVQIPLMSDNGTLGPKRPRRPAVVECGRDATLDPGPVTQIGSAAVQQVEVAGGEQLEDVKHQGPKPDDQDLPAAPNGVVVQGALKIVLSINLEYFKLWTELIFRP